MRIQRSHQRGTIIAFFLLLAVVLTTSLVATMAIISGTGSQGSGMTLTRDQAFYTAEAGFQRGLWMYKQTHSWRATASTPLVGSLTTSSGQYTYSVTCVDSGVNMVTIVSTVSYPTSPAGCQISGIVTGGGNAPGLAIGNNLNDSGTLNLTGDIQAKGNVTRTGTMNLYTITGGTPSSLEAMGLFNSTGTFNVPGNLLLNGSITSSNVVNVGGNAQAGAAINHSGNGWSVTGATNAYDSPNLSISTPTVDTATLIAQAQADGTVVTGGNKSNLTIDFTHGANHVVLIDGNVSLSGTTTIIGTGTLIVRGTFTSSSTIGTSASPVQMNLVTTTDATISGSKNYINGAVCIGGTLTKSGAATINGAVVVQGDLIGSGNITINYVAPPWFIQYSGGSGTGTAPVVQTFVGPIF